MKYIFNGKLLKGSFEALIIKHFPNNRLSKASASEWSNEKQRDIALTLYYSDGKHIGTWCQGKCWIFDWAAMEQDAQSKKVGDV